MHTTEEQPVAIAIGPIRLEGSLEIPEAADGIVLFAHGSGSSRHRPRSRFIAQELRRCGLGTLLFDLLTAEEGRVDERTRELRFDIDLLAQRLVGATDWLLAQPQAQGLSIGYFGASTGSAAALIAARERSGAVRAVVSRGGRPDLAAAALPYVLAPTLLIVGGNDPTVLQLNYQAFAELRAEKHLETILGATHLFEEPGALEEVARLAADWFREHLVAAMAG